jgi:hypothetical protein
VKARIEDFIWYPVNVGVEGLHMWGFPGSGKTNLGLLLAEMCMKETKDKLLLRGDRFCEWRHFMTSGFSMCLVIPVAAMHHIHEVNIELKEWDEDENFTVIYEHHEDLQVLDFLQKYDIVVLYDACFSLAARGWFWANIFEQLVNRIVLTNTVITYLDSEAGILLPEIALSESVKARGHWRAVNKVCELFVDFRKALIRPILISQLEAEINHRIRMKCMFNIIRQGVVGKGFPHQVVKEAPDQLINQFIMAVGKQLYTRGNIAPKYPEDPYVRKLIAKLTIEHLTAEEDNGHEDTDKDKAKRMRELGYSYDNIAYVLDKAKSTVWGYCN